MLFRKFYKFYLDSICDSFGSDDHFEKNDGAKFKLPRGRGRGRGSNGRKTRGDFSNKSENIRCFFTLLNKYREEIPK